MVLSTDFYVQRRRLAVAALVGECESLVGKGILTEPAEKSMRLLIAETLSAFGMQHHEFENEDILPDDYPIYADYFYVADGKLYRSDYHGITVRSLKVQERFSEVRRCNISARQAARQKETQS